MPIMPRTENKTAKIAFKILGQPGNMQKRKYKKLKNYPGMKTDANYEEFKRLFNK